MDVVRSVITAWTSAFTESAALATSVIAVHVIAMFVGGGLAIGADRVILRAGADNQQTRRIRLSDLASVHTSVIVALGLTMGSGLALLAADWELLVTSVVFWIKMVLVVVLLFNGLIMRRIEQRLLTQELPAPETSVDRSSAEPTAAMWRALRGTAKASRALWLLIVTLGVMLSNG